MTTIFEIVFFFLSFLIVNSFLIYPLVVFLAGREKKNNDKNDHMEPTISVLIAAWNEEKVIAERIENIASQNYNLTKLEVLVGSDASTDSTNFIIAEKQKKYAWLKVYISEKRIGKAGILNKLINNVNNEILVFTDANTEFHSDALKNIVIDFADKKVGGVCGKLILIDDDKERSDGVEEINYWKYETIIKQAEGKCGISLSANGGFFAIRKELYRIIPTEKAVTDDLFISLSVVSQGSKFTYREDAVAYENTGKNLQAEYKRKVRFSATNFQTLVFFKSLLLNKNKFLSYAFFSHKVTRWFLPMLLLVVLILSTSLSFSNQIYFGFLLTQLFFYLLALIGFVLSHIKVRIQIFSLPYFFVVSNFAVVEGFIKFLKRKHSVIWQSTER